MKLADITQPGFYWNRLDEYRSWTVVFVNRKARNPAHPDHGVMVLDGCVHPTRGGPGTDVLPAAGGDFVGPLEVPSCQQWTAQWTGGALA